MAALVPGIGRMQAQQLARAELSKLEYHRHIPLAQRIDDVILRFTGRMEDAAGEAQDHGDERWASETCRWYSGLDSSARASCCACLPADARAPGRPPRQDGQDGAAGGGHHAGGAARRRW